MRQDRKYIFHFPGNSDKTFAFLHFLLVVSFHKKTALKDESSLEVIIKYIQTINGSFEGQFSPFEINVGLFIL